MADSVWKSRGIFNFTVCTEHARRRGVSMRHETTAVAVCEDVEGCGE